MISKIENGRMLLNKKTFLLDEMLSKALDNYEMIARASAHQLVFESSGEPMPPMHGDPDLVIRIFDNLITNALKYSPANTSIRIRLLHDPAKDSIVAEVADQGSGVPREQQDLIFEKYGTLKNAPESVQQFGLGLYFCKLAVEAHKGTIRVKPNEPFGSVFSPGVAASGFRRDAACVIACQPVNYARNTARALPEGNKSVIGSTLMNQPRAKPTGAGKPAASSTPPAAPPPAAAAMKASRKPAGR